MGKSGRLVRWDITKNCNLSCDHCITENMYLHKQDLSKEQRFDIVDKLASSGVYRLHLLGGEPTVIPYISELIDYMFSKNIYVSLNTNGVRLADDDVLSDKLSRHGVGISFSIDGCTEKTHDSVRGRGSFDKVVNASKKYSYHVKNNGSEAVIAFYHTLTPKSITDDFNLLFELAEACGVNNIVIGTLIPLGAGERNYQNNVITPEDILRKTEEIVVVGKQFPAIKLSFPYQTPVLVNYLNEKLDVELDVIYSKCKSCKSEYQMQPDGAIYPCIFLNDKFLSEQKDSLYSDEKHNLMTHDFEEIIENNFFAYVRDRMNETDVLTRIEPCNTCYYNVELDICKPCIFQHDENSLATEEFHRNLICKAIIKHTKSGQRRQYEETNSTSSCNYIRS